MISAWISVVIFIALIVGVMAWFIFGDHDE